MNYSNLQARRQELVRILQPAISRSGGKSASTIFDELASYPLSELESMRQKQLRAGSIKPPAAAEPNAEEVERTLQLIRAEAERLAEPELARKREQHAREQEEHARQREETAREYVFAQIFRTPVNGQVAVRNHATEQIIHTWLNLDETLSAEWFIQVLKEQPQLARQLTWQSADVLNPVKQRQVATAQAEQDRKIFEDTARKTELYSINEANWSVVHSILGPGLSEFQIQNAVDSGAVRLTPATPSEVQEWRQELAEQRADYLANHASPAELREAANRESEQRRIHAQRQQVEQQIQAREQIDQQHGYPALPIETSDGVKIDTVFLKRLPGAELRKYMNRFGAANITARLNGVR